MTVAETETVVPGRLRDGTPYLSPSQVKTLLRCPQQYEYKYLEDKPDPIGISGQLGIAVHDAVAECMNAIVRGEPEPKAEDAADAAEFFLQDRLLTEDLPDHETPVEWPRATEFWEAHALALLDEYAEDSVALGWDIGPRKLLDAADEFARPTDDDWEPWYDHFHNARRLAAILYEESREKGLEPWIVEERLELKRDGIGVAGYCDLVAEHPDGETWLVDYKTAGSTPSYGRAKRIHTVQLALYAVVLERQGVPIDQGMIAYGVKNKTEKVCWSPVRIDEDTKAWAVGMVDTAHRLIRSGELPPNPIGAGFLCDEKYCSFWHECPGGQAPEEVPVQ